MGFSKIVLAVCVLMLLAGNPTVASDSDQRAGHVILRVGPGYNLISAESVAANLPEQCTHEITEDGGFPGHLTVEVGDKSYRFENSGEAGVMAERWCLDSLAKAGLTGKSVILRVGPGYDRISALVIKENLDAAGCPTTVTDEGGFPKRLIVQVGENELSTKSVGSAGAYAHELCLEGLK